MMNCITKVETKWDDEFLLEVLLRDVTVCVYISIMSLLILQPLSAVLLPSCAGRKNISAVSECDLMERWAL